MVIKRSYLVPIVSKALDVFELLQREKGPWSLEELHRQTHISKTTLFRILQTLCHRGYVARQDHGRLYHFVARPHKLRFGFGSQSGELPFARAVRESLQRAARDAGVDLLVLDNNYDPAAAVANAERFAHERVDLAIEFQTEQSVAPIVAATLNSAAIPIIAVDIPHPGAIYFGVDNYRCGHLCGGMLARAALTRWRGQVDRILGLDLREAGPLVQSRITGAFQALRSLLPNLPGAAFLNLDGRGLFAASRAVVLEQLRGRPAAERLLIAAANDTSALGALSAVRQLRREAQVMIAGQDGIPEARHELEHPGAFIGTLSHQAESYGPGLIELGMRMLRGEAVPPYNYVESQLLIASRPAAGKGKRKTRKSAAVKGG